MRARPPSFMQRPLIFAGDTPDYPCRSLLCWGEERLQFRFAEYELDIERRELGAAPSRWMSSRRCSICSSSLSRTATAW